MTQDSVWECTGHGQCGADVQGHGTHCAGTAGGKTYGTAPEALVYAIKTLSDQGSGARSWQISGIDWSALKPNCSAAGIGKRKQWEDKSAESSLSVVNSPAISPPKTSKNPSASPLLMPRNSLSTHQVCSV